MKGRKGMAGGRERGKKRGQEEERKGGKERKEGGKGLRIIAEEGKHLDK